MHTGGEPPRRRAGGVARKREFLSDLSSSPPEMRARAPSPVAVPHPALLSSHPCRQLSLSRLILSSFTPPSLPNAPHLRNASSCRRIVLDGRVPGVTSSQLRLTEKRAARNSLKAQPSATTSTPTEPYTLRRTHIHTQDTLTICFKALNPHSPLPSAQERADCHLHVIIVIFMSSLSISPVVPIPLSVHGAPSSAATGHIRNARP